MIFRERSSSRGSYIIAAKQGRLNKVIELSSKFSNDVKVLSEALILSGHNGHLDVVKWLGGHTAVDVNYNKRVLLTAACINDHLDIVKYLVETYHADVNLPDSEGDTSLTLAYRNVSMSVSQLHEACRYIRGDVTKVLRLVYVRGHKINVQNNDGNTPLHLACYNGYSNIVETLMLAGADETITNDEGKTPAQVAESNGHSELLKLLDRDSLMQVMLERSKKLKLSLVVLMMLTARLMRQRQMRGRWCHKLTVVHVMLTIRSIINFNRRKLKRKTNCVI